MFPIKFKLCSLKHLIVAGFVNISEKGDKILFQIT